MALKKLIDSVLAWLDRFGLWPVIGAAALVIGGYATGLIGQVVSFPLWVQVGIFAGVGLFVVWALSRVLRRIIKPSPAEIRLAIVALWTEGEALRDSEPNPELLADWTARTVALSARHATAPAQINLQVRLREPDESARLWSILEALNSLGDRY